MSTVQAPARESRETGFRFRILTSVALDDHTRSLGLILCAFSASKATQSFAAAFLRNARLAVVPAPRRGTRIS